MKYAAIISLLTGLGIMIAGNLSMNAASSLLNISRESTALILANQLWTTSFLLSIMGFLIFLMSAVITLIIVDLEQEIKETENEIAYISTTVDKIYTSIMVNKNAKKKKEKK